MATLEDFLVALPFELLDVEIEATISVKTIPPKFRMISFAVPDTREVLGIIGVNEFIHSPKSKPTYLMVGLNPRDIANLVVIHKDSGGNILPNPMSFSAPTPDFSKPVRKVKIRVNP